MKLRSIGLGVLILLGLSMGSQAFSASIKWYTYEEGVAQGKNQGKKVLINFFADWCRYCKKMEKTTFKDSSVVHYLNEHFIPIRVDCDREKQTASLYNIRGLPATWFLTEEGRKLSQLPGYIPPEKLLRILKYIHTESYKKMTFAKFLQTL